VRFWDFAGMDSAHRSFRDVEPHSGHQVRSLSYSINGDQFLVTTGNAKAKIYSRDGHETYAGLLISLLLLNAPKLTLFLTYAQQYNNTVLSAQGETCTC
jgi:hypothetical protein